MFAVGRTTLAFTRTRTLRAALALLFAAWPILHDDLHGHTSAASRAIAAERTADANVVSSDSGDDCPLCNVIQSGCELTPPIECRFFVANAAIVAPHKIADYHAANDSLPRIPRAPPLA